MYFILSLYSYLEVKNYPMGKMFIKTISCSIKTLTLKPKSTLIFRQCLPHQGMAYDKPNIRLFSYLMVKSLPESQRNATTRMKPISSQEITIKKLKMACAFIPQNKQFIKLTKRSRKVTEESPTRRSQRLKLK